MTGATARFARQSILVAGIALALVGLEPRPAPAHPLHTTLTEVTTDAAGHLVRAVIRVFEDDFGKALARGDRVGATGTVTEAAALAYLQRTFVLTGRDGRVMPLRSCGIRRTAGVLFVCVEAPSLTGLNAARLRNLVLCDLYDDQVNIVRAASNGKVNSMLFTRREPAKPLT